MNVEKTYTVRDLQEDYQTGRIRTFQIWSAPSSGCCGDRSRGS